MADQEKCRQCIQTQEQPSFPAHAAGTASSGSSLQLVGGASPIPGQNGPAEQEMPRASAGRLCQCPMKARPMPEGGGGDSPPSSPECPGGGL